MMSSSRPLVSVMVPARNAERTIHAALTSVLTQPGVELQVVVVNDASTDDTRSVVKAIDDDRIILIDSPGRGVNAARNAAMDVMTGDWVTLLDADDAWFPGRLGCLLEHAEASGAALISDDVVVESEIDGRVYSLLAARGLRRSEPFDVTPVDFIRADLGWLKPSVRSDLIRDGLRFPAHIRMTGDFPFWFRAVKKAGSLLVNPRPGYVHRRSEGSLSSESSELWLQSVAATAELLSHPGLCLSADERAALEQRLWLAWGRYNRVSAEEEWSRGQVSRAITRIATRPSIAGERASGASRRIFGPVSWPPPRRRPSPAQHPQFEN